MKTTKEHLEEIQREDDAKLEELAKRSPVMRQAVGAVKAALGGPIDLGADPVYMAHFERSKNYDEITAGEYIESTWIMRRIERGIISIEQYCAAGKSVGLPGFE